MWGHIQSHFSGCPKTKPPQKKATTEKLQKRRKNSEKEEKEVSKEDWMLENNKNADQEDVDHEIVGILDHKEKQSTTSDSGKELFYLVKFSPLFSEDESTKWIAETELFDCKELIVEY
jgi:hypothetical protein